MHQTYELVDAEKLIAESDNVSYAYIAAMVGTGKTVLDIGCGPGNLAQVLRNRGCEVVGVDSDESALRAAAAHCDAVERVDLDATPLIDVFPERRFDVVVFADALEHLRDPARALGAARAVLAPGGFVVASIPNVAHGAVRLALLKGRFEYQRLGILDETHLRFFTYESLESLFEESGYVVGGVERTTAAVFDESDLVPLVRREDYDPAVIDEVLSDPEAETLQFIVRAYPLDDGDVLLRLRSEISSLEQVVRTLRAELAHARATSPALAAPVVTSGEYLPAPQDAPQTAVRLTYVETEYRRALQLSDGLRRQLAIKESVLRAERARLAGEIQLRDAELASRADELAERDRMLAEHVAHVQGRDAEMVRLREALGSSASSVERLTAEVAGLRSDRDTLARRLAAANEELARTAERLERAHALLDLREATARDQEAAADALLEALARQRQANAVSDAVALDARASAALAHAEAEAARAAGPRAPRSDRAAPPLLLAELGRELTVDAPAADPPSPARRGLRRLFPR